MFNNKISKEARLLFIFLVLYCVSQGIILLFLGHLDVSDVLVLQLTTHGDVFEGIIEKWDMSGDISYYLFHFIPDYIHPFIYCAFLISWSRIVIKSSTPGKVIIILTVIAGICDLFENSLHLSVIYSFYIDAKIPVFVSGTLTMIKWILSLSLFLLLLIFSVIHFSTKQKIGGKE
jgi:hypothetical protein